MLNRPPPSPEEVMRQMAPGMVNKLLEQAQPIMMRKIQALLPLAKPAERADFVSAIMLVAKNGGQRDANSLQPLTRLLDSYAQKHHLPEAERERLLGELCVRYRETLQLLYSSMDIFFEGWTKQQLDAGWEATPVTETQVVKNAAGELTGVEVNVIQPPAH